MHTLSDTPIDGEYRLKLTVKNNLLLSAIERAGYRTVAEFSRAIGISQQLLGRYINLQEPACNAKGEWSPAVVKLCDFLGELPDDLFTLAQRSARVKRSIAFGLRERDAAALAEVLTPDKILGQKETTEVVERLLDTLSVKEKKVLCLRYGIGCDEHTLEQAARAFDVTRERVRQIEAKALRKLRHPSRRSQLAALDIVDEAQTEELEMELREYEAIWAHRELRQRAPDTLPGNLYEFKRYGGRSYWIYLSGDAEAYEDAQLIAGTIRVKAESDGRVIWEASYI